MKHSIEIGQTFEQWLIVSYSHQNGHYQHFWNCKCTCGHSGIIEQSRLVNGRSTKCKTCANLLRRKYKPILLNQSNYGELRILCEDPKDQRFVFTQCKCSAIDRLIKEKLVSKGITQCGVCRVRVAATKHGHNTKKVATPEYRAWRNAKNRVFNPKAVKYKQYGGRGITMDARWKDSFENFLQDIGLRPSTKHSLERIDNNGNYEPGNVRWALAVEQVRNRSVSLKADNQYLDVKKLAKEIAVHPKTIKNLLLKANFTVDKVRLYAQLTHYQKIEMGRSINRKNPYSLQEVSRLISPVMPRSKRHELWSTWHSMKQRCNNPRNKDYHNYGARGITVCNEWETFQGFLGSILAAIGAKPSPIHQLDRIDTSKPYEVYNIRWATRKEQVKNRRVSVYLEGVAVVVRELTSKYKIHSGSIIKLTRLGWNCDGLSFFAQLSFKQKRTLGILVNNLSQSAAIERFKIMYPEPNR